MLGFDKTSILVLGSFGHGAMEHFYVRGFQKQQFQVSTFDITKDYYASIKRSVLDKLMNKLMPAVYFPDVNKAVLEFISKKKFDVIIVFKGLTLFPSTIEELKQHTKVLCCYNPDHPFRFFSAGSGNKNIANSIKLYDIYFSYSKNIVAALKKDFNASSYTIPFGFDEEAVLSKNPAVNCTGKVAFIGSYDNKRAEILNRLAINNLIIFGDDKWKTRVFNMSRIKNAYSGRSLYGNDYVAANNTAVCVLNFLREQNITESSHNMRTFEAPGYGGLLLSQRTSEQMEYFEEGKEALFFDSNEELHDKLLFLSKHSHLIPQIKTAARERSVGSGYSYFDRSRQLFNVLKPYL